VKEKLAWPDLDAGELQEQLGGSCQIHRHWLCRSLQVLEGVVQKVHMGPQQLCQKNKIKINESLNWFMLKLFRPAILIQLTPSTLVWRGGGVHIRMEWLRTFFAFPEISALPCSYFP
jgi:hypothetical protein